MRKFAVLVFCLLLVVRGGAQLTAITPGAAQAVGNVFLVGSGGVTANKLVKVDTTGPNMVVAATTTDNQILGIAQTTVSAGGYVTVLIMSTIASCVFDNTPTAGHLATRSSSAGSSCSDTGVTASAGSAGLTSGTPIIGVITQMGSSGATAPLYLYGPGSQSSTGGSGITQLTGGVTAGPGSGLQVATVAVLPATPLQNALAASPFSMTTVNCTDNQGAGKSLTIGSTTTNGVANCQSIWSLNGEVLGGYDPVNAGTISFDATGGSASFAQGGATIDSGGSGTFFGLNASSQKITNVGAPVSVTDAARKGDIPTALPPNGTAGGDLSGSYPNPTVAKVNGVAVTGTPSTGQALVATGSTAATWQTVAGAGNVSTGATLTSNKCVIGNGVTSINIDPSCSFDGLGNGAATSYGTTGSTQGLMALAVGTGTIPTGGPTNYAGLIGPPTGTPNYYAYLPNVNPSSAALMLLGAASTVNGKQQAPISTLAGTTTTVLHGNASGAPTFGQLVIADFSATGTPSSTTCFRGDNTWATCSSGGFANPMTTLGDIITGGASGTPGRLAVGANGQVLTVVSGAPAWASAGSGSVTSVTSANSDASVANTTTTPVITINNSPSVGGITVTGTPSTGQVLTATSTSAANWQTAPGGGSVTSVTGTTNQINVATGTTNPVLSLSSTLAFPGTTLNAANGAASSPATLWTGTPFTGGTGTTTYPMNYFQCSGSTNPSTWQTTGTFMGFNSCSGFAGNYIDLHLNGGASVGSWGSNGNILAHAYGETNGVFAVSAAGAVTGTTFNTSTAASASTPMWYGSGTWFTGGTTTTTKPYMLIEPAGTTSTGWSTNGTALGINAGASFVGHLIDVQNAGTTKFFVDYLGNSTASISNAASFIQTALGGNTFTGNLTMSSAHLQFTQATAPVASSCGGGTVATGSSDNAFSVTGITAATSCTITFNTAISQKVCVANTSTSIATGPTSITTTAVTFGMAALTGTLYAVCF